MEEGDDEYELAPKKQIQELRQEIEKLRNNIPASPQVRHGKNLHESVDILTDSISDLLNLFRNAKELPDSRDDSRSQIDMMRKLDAILDENRKIAQGVVALADMLKKMNAQQPRPMQPRPMQRGGPMPPQLRPPMMPQAPPAMPMMQRQQMQQMQPSSFQGQDFAQRPMMQPQSLQPPSQSSFGMPPQFSLGAPPQFESPRPQQQGNPFGDFPTQGAGMSLDQGFPPLDSPPGSPLPQGMPPPPPVFPSPPKVEKKKGIFGF